jgi:hypothetical protein
VKIVPVGGSSDSPPGSAPALIENVYGCVPPSTNSLTAYGNDGLGTGSVVVKIVSAVGWIERFTRSCADTVGDSESVTCKVKVAKPGAAGVPDSTPVAALIVRPADGVPEYEYGAVPPVAVHATVKGLPTVA